jgi:hypothetical protein
VLENGRIVGRIFFLDAVGPQGRPWMWASGHNRDVRRAAHGYEPTLRGGNGGVQEELAEGAQAGTYVHASRSRPTANEYTVSATMSENRPRSIISAIDLPSTKSGRTTPRDP